MPNKDILSSIKFNFIKCKILFYSDLVNHEVNMETFNLDMDRINDINYFISHDVLVYMFKIMYMESKKIYLHDGSDPPPYLNDEREFFKRYLFSILLSLKEPKDLFEFVANTTFLKKAEKITYKKYCLVCMEIRSEVLINDCRHFCVCADCLTEIQSSSQKCPLCGAVITSSRLMYKHLMRAIRPKKWINRIMLIIHSTFDRKKYQKQGYSFI